jgi:hypothetical protein
MLLSPWTDLEAEYNRTASSCEYLVKEWASSVLEEFVASVSCLEDLGSMLPPNVDNYVQDDTAS